MKKTSKKIAIIIDKIGWAYYNSAIEIKENLKYDFEIDIIDIEMFNENIVKIFLLNEKYDLIFFMWRGLISWLLSDFSKDYIFQLGFSFEEFIKKYVNNDKITFGVYDHLFLEEEKYRTDFILENTQDYIVCSKKLYNIYSKFNKKPSMIISDGVDLNLFKMFDKNKYKNMKNKVLKIGWCGNSKFSDEHDDDLKGLNMIIKPAINELKNEGFEIQLKIADRNIKKIPHNEMPLYYNDIDIYVCASRTEGTPNPILEAMACGVPIVSTDVGIVSEVFGNIQKEYIFERNKEDLKKKLKKIYNNKDILNKLSEENLKQIKNWSWQIKSEQYKEFFEKNMKGDKNEK